MENPNQAADKQKVVAAPIATQALQVMTGAPPPPVVTGFASPALPQASLPPRVIGPAANPPRRSTSSDTSAEELSPALLGAIQQLVAAALREHVPVAAPPRLAPPAEADDPEEEDKEDAPVPVPPAGKRHDILLPGPQEVPPQWLARLEHLQKGLQDVKYQIEGAPEDERQGNPFAETVMADELPLNCRTPAIVEYDGTTDPMEHLSHFENVALLHRYTDGIKCRVFVTTFTRAAQQWFNQLPVGAIGSFQEFRSLFLHQFASSMKLRKTELSLFVVRQKDDEPLKEYLQRFNATTLKVPAATQEVKASAFSQGLLDGDLFKSLTKKPVSKFDALLARAAKYINMEEAQAAKKETREEKRKKIKEEAPSKKSRVDTRDRKSPFQRSRGTGPYQKKEGDKAREVRASSPERSSREGAKQTSGGKGENNDIPRKGVIRMIAGGPLGGDSHQARKSQVREAHQISIKEVLDVETMEDTPLIQFRRAERSPQTIHNDALVITAILANYEVGCIFIDSGSSADIIFGEAYDQMQLGDVSLEKVNTSLYGFAGEVVHPRGMVSLPLTMGRGTARNLLANIPSGGCALCLQCDPGDDAPDRAPPSKKGKAPEGENLEETETPAKVQPAEELLNIEIIPGNPDKTTRIGSHLGEEAKKEITLCLQCNADIFAWTPQDLEGIDPQVIPHHLNIDPNCKPVK
ncbi:UNVERIFIED_CONTAM: hypothetical protein Slati_0848900 [Sesamum latifolium]|uniref:Retrotransposon gag domain-containing protein n=1 Tax=Sesamum latifolium TaxID=2727402 RepID=A0AAW2XLU7_9LAMI